MHSQYNLLETLTESTMSTSSQTSDMSDFGKNP